MFGALLLIVGLVMHFAEVGFIGLLIVVLLTALNGMILLTPTPFNFIMMSLPKPSLLILITPRGHIDDNFVGF